MPDDLVTHRALDELEARDVMTSVLLTVSPDESVLMAYELMSRAGVHHVPVVLPTGKCLGVLDAQTLMQEWYPAPIARQRRPVRALLPARTASVRPEDPLTFVAEQLDVNATDAAPVVDDKGRLVGLVTARDIVAAVAGRERRIARDGTPVLFTMTPVLPEQLAPDDPADVVSVPD